MTAIYGFKSIGVVPNGKDFIDIVLSKTQRKTPTVVHKGYEISRIRQFYMRKIKYTQKTIDERLTRILSEFPRMDDIHPFYSDLMHVLYDRDHYKIALSQLSAVKHIVDSVGRDYVRLVKYGDSLYRCKQLKRAALGRMATACKKLNNALTYLERVRQHLARLPSIDPSCRTLLITGFPNVGKSSFMNRVTRADVEVQPYAFTTKSLYVGHTDYKYATWQVVDTPGILDHALEHRNVIEMQAITALAHLRACILYFMDFSGQCGYTLQQQISLFESIRPLFASKPLVLVFNKSDVCTLDDLSPEERDAVLSMAQSSGAEWVAASTLTAAGVADVKAVACERLLQHRAEAKEAGSRLAAVEGRLYTAVPQPRDDIPRPPVAPPEPPQGAATPGGVRRKVQRDYEWEGGGPGRYQPDERLTWDLEDPSWKHDIIPQVMDGHNIFDCIDPDINERLMELEDEEEERVQALEREEARKANAFEMDDATIDSVRFIRDRVKVIRMERALRSSSTRRTPRQDAAIKRFESSVGGSKTPRRGVTRSASADALSRDRSGSVVSTKTTRSLSGRSASRERSLSVQRGEGYRSVSQKLRAVKLSKVQTRSRSRASKMGEGDRVVNDRRPKHLFSGKVNVNGKRDRR